MTSLIGRGVYPLTDAARITGIPAKRIRRWTQGYEYVYRGHRVRSSPLIATAAQTCGSGPILDFLDLMEVRFLDAFRRHGVSVRAIRIAAERARDLLAHPRPFSSRAFKTDGRTILAELVTVTGDALLIDLVRNQLEFSRIISPMLYAGIDFGDKDEPLRWWPLGRRRRVLLDPLQRFGAPIVVPGHIPTALLSRAVASGQAAKDIADWYGLTPAAVRDALAYERQLAA